MVVLKGRDIRRVSRKVLSIFVKIHIEDAERVSWKNCNSKTVICYWDWV